MLLVLAAPEPRPKSETTVAAEMERARTPERGDEPAKYRMFTQAGGTRTYPGGTVDRTDTVPVEVASTFVSAAVRTIILPWYAARSRVRTCESCELIGMHC